MFKNRAALDTVIAVLAMVADWELWLRSMREFSLFVSSSSSRVCRFVRQIGTKSFSSESGGVGVK